MQVVRVIERKNLPGSRINETLCRYKLAGMQSEQFLTFLDTNNSSLVTILPNKEFSVVSKRVSEKCSFASMHPSKEVLALCSFGNGEYSVQVYDLAMKCKLKQIDLRDEVIFAGWIGDCFVFLTVNGIYHSQLDNDREPRVLELPKVTSNLIKCGSGQVVGYSRQGSWSCVFTIYTNQTATIEGIVHLFQGDKIQTFEGFGCDLRTVALFPGEECKPIVFCTIRKTPNSGSLSLLMSELPSETHL